MSSSPPPPPSSSSSMDSYHPPPSPDPGFPIVAVALIGILATSFLLVSYYVFAVKCGLGGQRVDVVFGRFWIFRRSRPDDPLLVYSTPRVPARGLNDAVIRSIPVRNFKSRGVGAGEDGNGGGFGERSFCECAVCLNEFQEDEKLKVIPTCGHLFHVDCIDVWLQNNANCPLCRTIISGFVLFPFNTASLASRSSPGDHEQTPEPLSGVAISGDEDFVVIEIDRGNGEGSQSPESSFHSMCITPRDSPTKSENKPGLTGKGGRGRVSRTRKMTSMGDESIDTRGEGEREFLIQPMRRSISMDSGTAGRALLQAVQEALSQQQQQRKRREAHEEATDEQACGTSGSSDSSNSNNIKMRRSRSFFSFGHHGRVPRSSAAVQPIAF
ncbi:hypothetical protein MLD38_011963 [Melastoma candidum]|uniref:Uncharacterized protein n=1 Tax=Melastoma candidum TaxID=119954 RepID=A0ACB9R4W8_9MYRT|nr:hypothetical protein MLD38_011963 [Melastoma candidum]